MHETDLSEPRTYQPCPAPVLELGRDLAARGHVIEFATLEGQEHWIDTDEYGFVSRVYLLGQGPTEEQLEAHYRRSQQWDVSRGISSLMESKYQFDSFWPQSYHGLRRIMDDASTRPDMLVADFFVDAVRDVRVEYGVPIAVVWPGMPFGMLPCSYIPGQPGFQIPGTLTSEDASMGLRVRNELVVACGLGSIVKWMRWTRRMRRANGVFYPPRRMRKPDYLVLVNSFFGLEVARDLPPTCALVGPLLSPTSPPLDEECRAFLEKHRGVLYIALGTHVIVSHVDAVKIISGVLRLLDEGTLDGVIWAIPHKSRQDLDVNYTFHTSKSDAVHLSSILSNTHPSFHTTPFAPQRAILSHPSTKLYLSHGGSSSANEALYHGVPMLVLGFFFDQLANSTRLVAAGVAEDLDKASFTADEVHSKARGILCSGENGRGEHYQRNVLRMKRIAHVAARRREVAADLVDEVLYDDELRFSNDRRRELRPMHLQTADMRMPVYKARNWDMYAVCALGVSVVVGGMGFLGRTAWVSRGELRDGMREMVRGVGGCWGMFAKR